MCSTAARSIASSLVLAVLGAAGTALAADPLEAASELLLELRPPDLHYDISTTPGAMFEPADRYAVTVEGRTLSVWHLADRMMKPMAQAEIAAEGASVAMHGLAVSEDGTIATLADDGTLRVWSGVLTPLATVAAWEGRRDASVAAVGIAKTGARVAWSAGRGDATLIRVYDYLAKKEVTPLDFGSTTLVWTLRFSPDGRFLAAGGPEVVVVWEVATGKVVERAESKARELGVVAFDDVAPVAYIGLGKRLLVRPLDGSAPSELETGIDAGASDQVVTGRGWLVYTSGDAVRRFDLATGRLVGRATLPGLPTVSHVSPDGTLVVSVSSSVVRVVRVAWR